MLGITGFWTYVLGTLAIVLLPGPNSIYVLSVGAQRGVRAGYRAAAGVFVGDTVLMALAAAGVASLLRTYPPIFMVIKYVGAAYLAWVGLGIILGAARKWRDRGEPSTVRRPGGAAQQRRPGRRAAGGRAAGPGRLAGVSMDAEGGAASQRGEENAPRRSEENALRQGDGTTPQRRAWATRRRHLRITPSQRHLKTAPQRSGRAAVSGSVGDSKPSGLSAGMQRPFRRALVVSLLNPKAILFVVSFFIQFVEPGYAHPALSFLVLGAVLQVFSALYLTALIFGGQFLAGQFRRRRRLAAGAATGVGAVFLGFGIKLATATAG